MKKTVRLLSIMADESDPMLVLEEVDIQYPLFV